MKAFEMCERALGSVGVLAHKCEHPFHLVYFGVLSIGHFSYKVVAMGCFVAGCLSIFCRFRKVESDETDSVHP